MKIKLQLFLLFIPLITSAQKLIRCNETRSFLVNQKADFYCYIKLNASVKATDNSKVINYHNYALQTKLVSKQDYLSKGDEDTPILTNYMISETQYFTYIYKENLNLVRTPVQLSKNKTAFIWFFDIPEKDQKQVKVVNVPIVKQVSISIVLGDFVYSISTPLLKNQSLDELKVLLSDLIITINYNNGKLEQDTLCDKEEKKELN